MDKENKTSQNNFNTIPAIEFSEHTNYEILPIEELRIQARNLMIENYMKLNKQKLIDAIRNAKSKH